MPPLNNYEELVPLPPNTRSTSVEDCSCLLCKISRLKLQDSVQHNKQSTNNKGAPVKVDKSPATTMKMCSKCFSIIGPGKEHECNKTSLNNNITEFIQQKSPNTRSKLACSVFKVKRHM